MFDVLVRAEDDSKIARIVERFKLVRVDSASIRADVIREKAEREQAETEKTARAGDTANDGMCSWKTPL